MAPGLHISIPETSTLAPSGEKAYTQYHIILQLPLGKHDIRKRYSDFVELDAQLTAQIGSKPPASLPAKSWIRRTVNNDALKEERRKQLERYVQSILNSEDARWRSSAPWRAFMRLPGDAARENQSSLPRSGGFQPTGQSGATLDPHEWLDLHRELKTQIQTARQQLKQREAASTAQKQHALSADAKATLVRAATTIAQLEAGLRSPPSDASTQNQSNWGGAQKLGPGELRRRRDLVGAAKKEVEALEGVLRAMATHSTKASNTDAAMASAGDKAALWNGTAVGSAKGRVLGGPLKETERTREVDNTGVLQLQQQIMEEQEEDVLSLGKTVAKLKEMGIMINEELEVQNEMLGLVDQDTDRLQGKVDVARSRIKKIS